MSGLIEARVQKLMVAEKPDEIASATTSNAARFKATSVDDEQVRSLTQQLFFRSEAPHYRHVGFVAADPENDMARLCLSVARVVVAERHHDVGMIDASPKSGPVEIQIGKQQRLEEGPWEFEARLWFVPRKAWLEDENGEVVSSSSLMRLRELTTQFDFSVWCCGPMSWLAARIGQACDGLVLVLTANRTRRLVAEQMKAQLRVARVPLLGTVLAERRFPVPTALYRKL